MANIVDPKPGKYTETVVNSNGVQIEFNGRPEGALRRFNAGGIGFD